MTRQNNDNKLDAVMELLIENGFEGFAEVLWILLNEAMKIERDQALGAQPAVRVQSQKVELYFMGERFSASLGLRKTNKCSCIMR